jgi:hypothetical protein
MATNNENSIYDETRSEINEPSETANSPVPENEPAKTTHVKSGVVSAAVGVTGAAAGIGGALLISGFKEPDNPVQNPNPDAEPVPVPEQYNGETTPIALQVNNDMTFEEAFAAARQEVGAGGIFSWHGHTYGTYYVDEWQVFSDEYRQTFSDYPYKIEHQPYFADEPLLAEADLAGSVIPDVEEPQLVEADLTDSEDPVVAEPQVVDAEAADDVSPDDILVIPDDVSPDDILVIPDDENEVSILNVAPVDMEGDEVTLVSTGVDGQDVVLVDANLDDMYDVTVIDENGEPEDVSIYEIEPEGNNDEEFNNFE